MQESAVLHRQHPRHVIYYAMSSEAVTNTCRRMQEVRSSEQRATVEDLMYASVLEKFMNLKVEMMPRWVPPAGRNIYRLID